MRFQNRTRWPRVRSRRSLVSSCGCVSCGGGGVVMVRTSYQEARRSALAVLWVEVRCDARLPLRIRRRGQVVRRQTANLLFVGSIPTGASATLLYDNALHSGKER